MATEKSSLEENSKPFGAMASLGAHSVARFASKDAPEHDPFGPKQSLFTSPSLGLRPSVVLASMTNEESVRIAG
ncbi:hypothetical protein HZH66_012366 [Vespula vulgaris]|uniref:Uncharacterized protein n=1 Tax=Vespula vulgaris TaxID=7454 RepID=A0A834JAQ5_VESVU|nr:hypothetical protein HZH66_012366 [Vespula vulgaris]